MRETISGILMPHHIQVTYMHGQSKFDSDNLYSPILEFWPSNRLDYSILCGHQPWIMVLFF